MNLRAKLNAIASAPKKTQEPEKKPEPVRRTCWERTRVMPVEDLDAAFALSREPLMLMQGEEMPQPFDPTRILYLDTETTGLSGGAGTVAFLIGVGHLTEDGFELRQLVMRDYP